MRAEIIGSTRRRGRSSKRTIGQYCVSPRAQRNLRKPTLIESVSQRCASGVPAVSLRKRGSPCKSRRKDVDGGDAWTLGNLCQKEICRVTLSKSVHCIERAAERGV